MMGICTFCGRFGGVQAHHLAKNWTIIVCSSCHMALHRLARNSETLSYFKGKIPDLSKLSPALRKLYDEVKLKRGNQVPLDELKKDIDFRIAQFEAKVEQIQKEYKNTFAKLSKKGYKIDVGELPPFEKGGF